MSQFKSDCSRGCTLPQDAFKVFVFSHKGPLTAAPRFVPALTSSSNNSGQKIIWYSDDTGNGRGKTKPKLTAGSLRLCVCAFLCFLICGCGAGGITQLPVDQINGLILDIILALWKARRAGNQTEDRSRPLQTQTFTIAHGDRTKHTCVRLCIQKRETANSAASGDLKLESKQLEVITTQTTERRWFIAQTKYLGKLVAKGLRFNTVGPVITVIISVSSVDAYTVNSKPPQIILNFYCPSNRRHSSSARVLF